jgi:glucose/arabinose dehydrogenase
LQGKGNHKLHTMTIQYSTRRFFTAFALLLFCSISRAQVPTLTFQPVITSGISSPVDITNAKDGSNRLFVVERDGRIKILNGSTLLPTPFLDITTTVAAGGEQGLLSLAFHPDYTNNRYFFVFYTATNSNVTLARYRTQAGNPNLADPASGVVLMSFAKPNGFTNHNGGDLNFGPDGKLYLGFGDGGSGGDPFFLGQRTDTLFGKMIRLDVDNFNTPPYYTIPADNPYVGDPLIRDEIWAIGLRNPWRWSFDRLTGDMWIADVGDGTREEVNVSPAGATGGINYGWRCYEGSLAFSLTNCGPIGNYQFPIFDYPHNFATGGFSITGGFVYRGTAYPALVGYYVCADYVTGRVWKIRNNGSTGYSITPQNGLPGSISSFGEAENGELYAVALSGSIYQVQANAVLPVTLTAFTAQAGTGFNEISWTTTREEQVQDFTVEFSRDGNRFEKALQVAATGAINGNTYRAAHPIVFNTRLFYRLAINDRDGNKSYSAIVTIDPPGKSKTRVFPTVINDGLFYIATAQPSVATLLSTDGKLVWQKNIAGNNGVTTMVLPAGLSKGIYLLQLKSISGKEIVKLVVE